MPKGNKPSGWARSKARAASGAAGVTTQLPGESRSAYSARMNQTGYELTQGILANPVNDFATLSPGQVIMDNTGRAFEVVGVSRGVPTVRPMFTRRGSSLTTQKLTKSARGNGDWYLAPRSALAQLGLIKRQLSFMFRGVR